MAHDAALDPTLVAYWTFDEGSGTTAHDASGHGLDGTLEGGATWAAGKIGGALSLDGTDDIVAVPLAGQLQLGTTGPFTLSAWIFDDTPAATLGTSNWHRIVTWADASGEGHTLGLGTDPAVAKRVFFVGDVEATTQRAAISTLDVAPGWHLATGTFDGATFAMYVDGVRDDGGTLSSGITGQTDTTNLYLGGKGDDTRFVKGLLDDIQIYDRALGATEIAALFER